MRAVLCPVCGGSGKYTEQPSGDSSGGPTSQTCHGCGGRGWVEVSDGPMVVPSVWPYYPQEIKPVWEANTWATSSSDSSAEYIVAIY